MAGAGKAQTPKKRHVRSRIANGSQLLPTVHPQSLWARLARDELERLINHCGGDDVITEPKRLAARRVAIMEAELVHAEDKIGKLREQGQEPPEALVEFYGRVADRQRRQSEMLGYERVARDVTPTLEEYGRVIIDEGPKP